MVDQLQYPGLIQSDHNILADQDSGHPAQTAPGEFRGGLGISVDIFFGETYVVLRKELLGRFTMGSGLSGEQGYFLHKYIPLTACVG